MDDAVGANLFVEHEEAEREPGGVGKAQDEALDNAVAANPIVEDEGDERERCCDRQRSGMGGNGDGDTTEMAMGQRVDAPRCDDASIVGQIGDEKNDSMTDTEGRRTKEDLFQADERGTVRIGDERLGATVREEPQRTATLAQWTEHRGGDDETSAELDETLSTESREAWVPPVSTCYELSSSEETWETNVWPREAAKETGKKGRSLDDMTGLCLTLDVNRGLPGTGSSRAEGAAERRPEEPKMDRAEAERTDKVHVPESGGKVCNENVDMAEGETGLLSEIGGITGRERGNPTACAGGRDGRAPLSDEQKMDDIEADSADTPRHIDPRVDVTESEGQIWSRDVAEGEYGTVSEIREMKTREIDAGEPCSEGGDRRPQRRLKRKKRLTWEMQEDAGDE
jgi:hypothetical protein